MSQPSMDVDERNTKRGREDGRGEDDNENFVDSEEIPVPTELAEPTPKPLSLADLMNEMRRKSARNPDNLRRTEGGNGGD